MQMIHLLKKLCRDSGRTVWKSEGGKRPPKPYSVKEVILRTASVSSLFVTFGTFYATYTLRIYLLFFTHLPLLKHITSLKRPLCFGSKRIFPFELIIFTLCCLFSHLGLLFFQLSMEYWDKRTFYLTSCKQIFCIISNCWPFNPYCFNSSPTAVVTVKNALNQSSLMILVLPVCAVPK